MGVPVAAGVPSYSGNFIPALWSPKLNVKFYATTVCGEICNTDWEGEIKEMGDKVTISNIPSITVRKYKKGQSLTYEVPEQTPVELNIDQGTYFGVSVNDVDEYQSNINLMNTFTDDASQQIQIEVDTTVLGTVYADVAAANKGATAGTKSGAYNLGAVGSPLTLTAADAISVLTRAGAVLDEQNVPHTDRFMVVPAWFRFLIMNSDLKNANMMGDEKSILRNGRVGVIDRFTIYQSNLLASSADSATEILFGHKSAIAFASQITKTESLPNPNDFGQIVRGLNVYGFNVVKPEALGWIHAKM